MDKNSKQFIYGESGGITENINNPFGLWYKNVLQQANFFLSCTGTSVFYGASCVYPKNAPNPIKEESLGKGQIEETSAAYAYAKLSGIAGCKAYNKQHPKTKIVCLIPATIYGPGYDKFNFNGHVLQSLISKIHNAKITNANSITLLGTGSPKREFIYREDLDLAAKFAVANVKRLENTHYNVGSGEEISIKNLAKLISSIVGYKGLVLFDFTSPDGSPRKLLDSSKFKALGWEPKTFLEDGISKTYDWYLKYHEGQ